MFAAIVCLLLNAIGFCYSLKAGDFEAFYRLAEGNGADRFHKRDGADEHDPIYDMIAKRNLHDWAMYEKRDDNEHTNDLAKEWLRRATMSQTKLSGY